MGKIDFSKSKKETAVISAHQGVAVPCSERGVGFT